MGKVLKYATTTCEERGGNCICSNGAVTKGPCPAGGKPGSTNRNTQPNPTNPGSPMPQGGGLSHADGTTTVVAAPTGTNYTMMALYVLGGGAIGYGISHFALKGKKIAGLTGMHLNLAIGVAAAIGGYFIYKNTVETTA